MKKCILVCLAVLLVMAATAPGAWAGDDNISDVKDSHEIRQVWDLSGTFVAWKDYDWGGLAEGATWSYSIHIEEAMDGELSVGSIRFWTADGIEVVGQVEATARDYAYWLQWGDSNLAAVGRAEYNDTLYKFMLLYAEKAVHFTISDVRYDAYWSSQRVWPRSLRLYELHSLSTRDFPFQFDDNAQNAVDHSHKVRNVWDLSGTFVAWKDYDWGELAEGATWSYSIHIEEATDGDLSVGSVHFWNEVGIEVVGHIESTVRDYAYWCRWGDNNLAAVGTAEYNDTTYKFMLLYAEKAIWFAISDVPYDAYWTVQQRVWPRSLRLYELHSLITHDFPFNYKAIHTIGRDPPYACWEGL